MYLRWLEEPAPNVSRDQDGRGCGGGCAVQWRMAIVQATQTPRTGVMVNVKAVPGASRSEIVGALGEELKVRLAAPSEDGRATRELVQLLAQVCGLGREDVEVISGHGSAHKRVLLVGIDAGEAGRRLGVG